MPSSTRVRTTKASTARARARTRRHNKLLTYERALWTAGALRVAGVDEVGAGPLAGPVVAACVVLDPERTRELLGVNDSKQLTAAAREALDAEIRAHALAYAVAECSVEEIDTINIRAASMLAMVRAIEAVEAQLGRVDHVLVDAHHLQLDRPQTAIIKGDATSLAIAAASIIAKVARDVAMDRHAATYPGYGFDRHKGYGTSEHLDALRRLGPTPLHRRSFAPVRMALEGPRDLFGHPG